MACEDWAGSQRDVRDIEATGKEGKGPILMAPGGPFPARCRPVVRPRSPQVACITRVVQSKGRTQGHIGPRQETLGRPLGADRGMSHSTAYDRDPDLSSPHVAPGPSSSRASGTFSPSPASPLAAVHVARGARVDTRKGLPRMRGTGESGPHEVSSSSPYISFSFFQFTRNIFFSWEKDMTRAG